jgi:acetyl-CoA synthetase/medium-chain acyl-CoA synthetase
MTSAVPDSGYQVGDYAETYRTFSPEVPEKFNWAFDVFDRWGDDPDKVATVWLAPDGQACREVTFREFSERSRRVANALTGLGAEKGDRVFLMLHRVVEWWEIVLGCMRAGLVPVPGTTLLTAKDIAYRIGASESSIAITDPENQPKLESVRDECPSLRDIVIVGGEGSNSFENLMAAASPELPHPHNPSSDPLMIYFTSGTTGNPKMVLNTHASYPIGHVATGKFWLDNRPTDLHWTLADTGWAQAAWTAFFAPWNMGAALFIWDQRSRFDGGRVLDILEKFPITTFFAPPTAYRMMVQCDLSAFTPKALRHTVAAGEAVDGEVIDAWRAGTGLHIWEGYGQTESTLMAATFPGMRHKPGSMGVACPGFELAIVDDDGRELPAGEVGQIAVRTSPVRPVGLFPGYWRDPEANAKAFRGEWYFTGDLATRDEDGYFWFLGRGDDLIISASYRIGPFEVESALMQHPAVAEAAVVARPDPIRGQIVKAFVALTSGTSPSDQLAKALQAHVREVTAPYKYPREIEFIDELPKTVSGKIRRNELRRRDRQAG